MARSAASISAWDICSKSRVCRTSRSDTVKVASTSTSGGSSDCSGASPWPGCCSASCRRRLSCLPLSCCGRHVDLRQQHVHHLLEQARIAPVDVERLVEDLALVAAVHEHRMERPVEVVAVAQARRLHRLDGAQDLPRPDPQAGRAQRPREMHDVARKLAVARLASRKPGRRIGQHVHRVRLSPAAGRRCRTSPCAGSPPLPSPAGAGCRPGT